MKDLGIVIIAHNEEKALPALLDSIKRQRSRVAEIIVAHGGSTDKTLAIARAYGCKAVPGGETPSQKRNIGARHAKSDILLFLDGDGRLPDGFIPDLLEFVRREGVDVAAVNLAPDTGKAIDKALLSLYNSYQVLLQRIWPHGTGACILCKRELFREVGGFDDRVRHAEDMDFLRRAAKRGKFRVFTGKKIVYSMRRYEENGRVAMVASILRSEIYRARKGEIRDKRLKDRVLKYEDRQDWLRKSERKRRAAAGAKKDARG